MHGALLRHGGPALAGMGILLMAVTGAMASPAYAASGPQPPARRGHSVELTWTPSPTAGVMGYNVYRATAPPCPVRPTPAQGPPPACAMQLLNATPVPQPRYEDRDVRPGQTYYYEVRTVAADGALSQPSNTTTATICSPDTGRPAKTGPCAPDRKGEPDGSTRTNSGKQR